MNGLNKETKMNNILDYFIYNMLRFRIWRMKRDCDFRRINDIVTHDNFYRTVTDLEISMLETELKKITEQYGIDGAVVKISRNANGIRT
jgi:hypothetical protein